MRRAVLATLLAASSAQAEEFFTVNDTTDTLTLLDTATSPPTLTSIGPLGASFDFGALAWDGATLWMIGGLANAYLHTVDPTTGVSTRVGAHGVRDLFAMTWDPDTGALYAGDRSGGFYRLDPATGAATPIGRTGIDHAGMTHVPGVGIVADRFSGSDLYVIDPATAVATRIGGGGVPFDDGGLAWSQDDRGYYRIDGSGTLHFIDGATFATTPVATGLGAHDGLTPLVGGSPTGVRLRITGSCPGMMTLDLAGLTPGSTFVATRSSALGSATIPGGRCAGTALGLAAPGLIGFFPTGSGTRSFLPSVGGGSCGDHVQVVDLATCQTSNVAQF